MDSFKILARSLGDGDMGTVDLLIVILSLVLVGLILSGIFILLRRMRRRKQQMRDDTLPRYEDVKRTGNHRRLTIQTQTTNGKVVGRSSVIIVKDGQPMLANPHSPPYSPDNVPEIHITFPDEQDENGRRKSGRVVVVRVGDTTVGLEPLYDEQLPAYEKESSTQFYAIDMDHIGGLKEKHPVYS